MPNSSQWPELPYAEWADTCATLQLWTQIVGKTRLALTPWLNHSWHVTLHVTRARACHPAYSRRRPRPSDRVRLRRSCAVAAHERRPFPPAHAEADDGRGVLCGISPAPCQSSVSPSTIDRMPNELADPIPFDEDTVHAAYDREYASRFWRVLLRSHEVFSYFRTALPRQGEPGAFLLGQFRSRGDAVLGPARAAASRAAFRICPMPSRAKPIRTKSRARDSGPAAAPIAYPAFYSYAYPAPEGFSAAAVKPARGVLQQGSWRVHPALRCRAHRAGPETGPARFSRKHLRRGGRSRPLGPRGARMRLRRARPAARRLAISRLA